MSVIIVNFNTFELTRRAISSIYEQTSGVELEIILVDNGSTERPAADFSGLFPEIKLVESGENLGFSRGNNLGISHASGKYILLLNSDTELLNNAVKACCDFMEQQPEVGVVSGQLVYPDGRVQSVCQRFPGIKYKMIELLRLQKLMSVKKRGRVLLGSFFDHKSEARPDWVWGTYFFFRSSILESLPGAKLDDTFFMYGEDMQWCWDISKLGWQIAYFPRARILHHGAGSGGDKTPMMRENYEIFIKRNLSPVSARLTKWLDRALSK